ncbi:MAG TPA: T9SS type A sorting domain-containing protein, partial [Chitinophagales bacterium]|nr:T9SS type A sorting domain-containing protein [Chitinophagales bacterium]
NGFFDIKITALKSAKYDLTLYNVTGQEILKDELNIQQGENVKRFNLNEVAKGMYFITLTNEDGISTQNIIVQ